MASNKENDKRFILKSKIPLPVNPLPGIDYKKILIKKNSKNERRPLKTLQAQASNVPNQNIKREYANKPVQKKYTLRKSRSLTLISSHATVGVKQEKLDCDYNVFKDDLNHSDIYIRADDVDEAASISDNTIYYSKKDLRKCFVKTSTPAIPSLFGSSQTKNIKKSPKLPHSRELLGSLQRLNFKERSSEFGKSSYLSISTYKDSFPREYESDIFTYLITKEKKWPKHVTTPNATRACLLNWLLKINGAGGNPATIQTAIWYFDSVLALAQVSSNYIQVYATACFWIAQKIHGPVTTSHELVKCLDHAVTTKYLLKAEKLILKHLKMPSQPVLPQEFITYLSLWCSGNDPDIELAATFICMCGMILDMGLLDEYPSVIGAAAVRNAVILLRKRDLLITLETCPEFEEIEKKSNFYNVCAIQRKAVLLLASDNYKEPLEVYNNSSQNIPLKILLEVEYLSMVEKRTKKIDFIPKSNKIFEL
ncbi:uncharacterized protein LOC123705438 [Colias croceus]|uniref:uncharacterized protein LOC123705438 n=1 Tax=Colias crocea TaxID=72248 RepID=UPI001E27CA39|nr:uncharacterized protein LOC123705438 [Colias croceus]